MEHLDLQNRKVIKCFLLSQHNTDSFILRNEKCYYTFACVFDWEMNKFYSYYYKVSSVFLAKISTI